MKRSILFFMAVAVLAAISCTKDSDTKPLPEKELVAMSFDATLSTPTKTELGESNGAGGYKVLWSKDDAIKVYPHDGETQSSGIAFTTDIASASASATFSGEIEAAEDYYAFYPGSVTARWYPSNKDFGVTLSDNQTSNGIANGFMVSKADSENNLLFDHVCGYVKFVIPDEYDGKISKVYFEGKNEESLAGYLWIFPDDMTKNKINSSPKTKLTLNPASGDAFASGTYYFTIFPTALEDGFTLTFIDTEARTATKSTDNPATISAGRILNLGSMTGLLFVDLTSTFTLPWSEDCSEGEAILSDYVISNVKIANEAVAGGTSPEFFLQGSASLSAKVNVAGKSRNLTLTYKTNKYNKSDLTLSVQGENGDDVTMSEKSSSPSTKMVVYNLTLKEGVDMITVTWSSTANSRLDDIHLFEGTKKLQTLSFSSMETTATVGQVDFAEPTLDGNMTPVTYISSNSDVATVNASTGEVTLKAAGEATITATASETDDYFGGTTSYVLTVKAAGDDSKTVTLSPKSISGNTTVTDDAGNSWNITSDGNYTTNKNYVQVGTNDKPVSYLTLTTEAYESKKIKSITVYATSKANTNVTTKITVGSTLLGTSDVYKVQNAASGGTEFTVDNSTNASGNIDITISKPSSTKGAIYFVKALIVYED